MSHRRIEFPTHQLELMRYALHCLRQGIAPGGSQMYTNYAQRCACHFTTEQIDILLAKLATPAQLTRPNQPQEERKAA